MATPQLQVLASTLRFAGGDLLVKLSDDTSLDLLLHKSIVAESCPALEPILRNVNDNRYSWGFHNRTVVTRPDGTKTHLHTIAMKFVDGILNLEGPTFQGVPHDQECTDFDKYQLPNGDLPYQRHTGQIAEPRTAQHIICIFRILHGMPFSIDDLCCCYYPINVASDFDLLTGCLDEMCARADYMGCLPQVADALERTLLQCEHLWEAVMGSPSWWLEFAVTIRCKEIYFDALRHLMASTRLSDKSFLAERHGMTVRILENSQWRLLAERNETVQYLTRKLRGYEMTDAISDAYGGGKAWNKVPFLVKSRFVHHTEAQKRNQFSELVARWQVSQWSAQYEDGDYFFISRQNKDKLRGKSAGPLNKAIKKLEDSVKAGRPLSLFQPGVVSELLEIFRIGEECRGQVHFHLCTMLTELDALVKTIFEVREAENEDGEIVTYRRAHHDVGEDDDGNACWTYIALNEENVPWKNSAEWPGKMSSNIAPVMMWPATKAEQHTVGIILATVEEIEALWTAKMATIAREPEAASTAWDTDIDSW